MRRVILVPILLSLAVSASFAMQSNEEVTKEKWYPIEDLPTFIKTEDNEFKTDATLLIALIQSTVDVNGWKNPNVAIETITNTGQFRTQIFAGHKSFLRVVQTQRNHEQIVDLMVAMKKASPYYVPREEEKVLGTQR